MTTRCEFSRYVTATPVKGRGIQTVIESINGVFSVLGVRPETIALDNEFNTEAMRSWSKDTGTKVHFRCSNNSRSIGVERIHQDIHRQFSKIMFGKNPRAWHLHVREIVDPLNKSVHSVTRCSPHKVVFGVSGQTIGRTSVKDKSDEFKKRNQLYRMIRGRILASKSTYSSEHKWPSLFKNENVIVKYTDSKNEKERFGIVKEFSNSENPRAEIHFPENPPKFRNLGIHKGHIFRRVAPLPPFVSHSENEPKEKEDKHRNVDSVKSIPLIQNETGDETSIVKKSRPQRNRRAPNRLMF